MTNPQQTSAGQIDPEGIRIAPASPAMVIKAIRPRRMARPAAASATELPRAPNKLDQIEALLLRANGASIAEMISVTGWQPHSVRGAMAGALRKRGITITSDKKDGVRRYRANSGA